MSHKKTVFFVCATIFSVVLTQTLLGERPDLDVQKDLVVSPYGVIMSQDFTKIPHAIVEQVQLFSKVHEDSDERIERKGVLVRYPNADGTILICHGFMCDKFDVAFLRNLFPKKKFNIMTFDFRAHGENTDGQICTFGKSEALDVQTAANFLRQHPALQSIPLFVYGFSMGSVAAIEAQSKDPLFDAMILDCPFDSSKNLIRNGLSKMKITLFGKEFDIPGRETLEKYAFHPYVQTFLKLVLKTIAKMDTKNIQTNICPVSPKKSIRKVTIPCFFIHCKNDELVPVDAIKKIYERAPGYKDLWITEGRRHYDSPFYDPEVYAHKIKAFLYKIINKEYDPSLGGAIIENSPSDNTDEDIDGDGMYELIKEAA